MRSNTTSYELAPHILVSFPSAFFPLALFPLAFNMPCRLRIFNISVLDLFGYLGTS